MPNIPMGFQLTISSWENDADCYTYQTRYGLKNLEVQFYIELAKQFYAHEHGLGNDYQTNETLFEIFTQIKQNHPTVHIQDEPNIDNIFDWFAKNILGYPVDSGYYEDGKDSNFCRVFDEFTVHHIPTICLDMTEQYK